MCVGGFMGPKAAWALGAMLVSLVCVWGGCVWWRGLHGAQGCLGTGGHAGKPGVCVCVCGGGGGEGGGGMGPKAAWALGATPMSWACVWGGLQGGVLGFSLVKRPPPPPTPHTPHTHTRWAPGF